MDNYIVNCWLEGYPSQQAPFHFTLEDFFDKKQYQIDNPQILTLLSYCIRMRTRNSIVKYIEKNIGKEEGLKIFEYLVKNNLIVTIKSSYYKAYERASIWRRYEWTDALDYFIAIRDYPFLDYSKTESYFYDKNKMTEYVGREPLSPIYKTYKHAAEIVLDKDASKIKKISVLNTLKLLKPENELGDKKISKKVISELLYTTFGQIGEINGNILGKRILKTSPSGGSRHPIEAYVVILDSEIQNGIYHYSVKNNSLKLIQKKSKLEELSPFLLGLDEIEFKPKMIIIMSAIFERSMWRYREYRSYRAVMHDLGHLSETLKLVSFANGLNIFSSYGFDENKTEKYLKIKSENESVIRFAAVG